MKTEEVKKINKKKNYNKPKNYKVPRPSENPKWGYCEYVMSQESAKDILATRPKGQAKMDPQAYLCEYVNSQYGLMSYCTAVKYV